MPHYERLSCPSPCHPPGNRQFALRFCESVFVSLRFFNKTPHVSDDHAVLVFFFFSSDLCHFAQCPLHPCCHKWQDFIILYGRVILHRICTPHFLYPFFCHWLLDCSHISAIINNAAVNPGVHTSFRISGFVFLQIKIQKWNCWVVW